MNSFRYNKNERQRLLFLARSSIKYALENKEILTINLDQLPTSLREKRAAFVTIRKRNRLRGCMGSLEAERPLALDIVHNSYSAAFSDPRFEPVKKNEFKYLELHLSILNPYEALLFNDENDLIKKLRPGLDGIILQENQKRATFLPAVWEAIPEPDQFLMHLKAKAGFERTYWSGDIKVYRYTSESIP